MMTVVVKEVHSAKIIVFTKGADSSVAPLCKKNGIFNSQDTKTMDHLDSFASEGLRTLAFAYKEI